MRKNRLRLRGFDLIYFMHIPKTGGISLLKAVSSVIHESQMLHVPFDIKENYIAAADPLNHSALRFVSGHFDYEFQRHLPRPPIYITMLRHPVERVLSLYDHMSNPRNFPRTPEIMLDEEFTLQQFIAGKSGRPAVTNYQAKMLVGQETWLRLRRRPRTLLDIAKARLDDFAFVGLTERFEESIKLLFATFDWPAPFRTPCENRGRARSEAAHISSRTRALIEEANEIDLELYQYALDELPMQIDAPAGG